MTPAGFPGTHALAAPVQRPHGGPDSHGPATHDFSVNSHPAGPCTAALRALAHADASRYPDPAYTALRERLADFHAVEPGRVLLAASASEFIFRITAAAVHRGVAEAWMPAQAYGDYAQAARAFGLAQAETPARAGLVWGCEPSSPLGQPQAGLGSWIDGMDAGCIAVLDRAYEPMRLEGACSLDAAGLLRVWQLWTPNKALGLTGVRAAYAIAPDTPGGAVVAEAVEAMCPSWPVGAHGVALLSAWTAPETQAWLAASLAPLSQWKAAQRALCEALGWECLPSQANFFCARPVVPAGRDLPQLLAALRARGVKLRDAASFHLPGWVRLGVLPPASQQALRQAWLEIIGATA